MCFSLGSVLSFTNVCWCNSVEVSCYSGSVLNFGKCFYLDSGKCSDILESVLESRKCSGIRKSV